MENNYFTSLPLELKEKILSYLKAMDVHFLSKVYRELKLDGIRLRMMDFSQDFRLDLNIAKNIFKRSPRLLNVTHLNLNGVYWIEAVMLRKFISRLENLESAFLLGTKLGFQKEDVTLYMSLKKLQHLAASSRIFEYPVNCSKFSCFDIIYYNEDNTGSQDSEQGINMGLLKTFKVILGHHDCSKYYRINGPDWMNKVLKQLWCANEQSPLEGLNVTKRRIKIQYLQNGFSIEDHSLEEMMTNHPDTKELILRRNPRRRAVSAGNHNLLRIPMLKNLTHLHLELIETCSVMLLHDIFIECKELRWLKIINSSSHFNGLGYLKHANKLEDLCLVTKDPFQIDKFFLDLLENETVRMKRISLNFSKMAICSMYPINTFLQRNPQLIFLLINCSTTHKVKEDIQKSMNAYVKSPKQVYTIRNLRLNHSYFFDFIPVAHFDLLDTYYHVEEKFF